MTRSMKFLREFADRRFNKENITEQRRVDDLIEGNTLMGRIILREFCCAGFEIA